MEILVMNKKLNLSGAVLSTLLFSSIAIGHQAGNDVSGDVVYGHGSDHRDAVLDNPSKSMAATHNNEEDKEDVLHNISEHGDKLSATSPSGGMMVEPHANEQDQEDALHQITEHKK